MISLIHHFLDLLTKTGLNVTVCSRSLTVTRDSTDASFQGKTEEIANSLRERAFQVLIRKVMEKGQVSNSDCCVFRIS